MCVATHLFQFCRTGEGGSDITGQQNPLYQQHHLQPYEETQLSSIARAGGLGGGGGGRADDFTMSMPENEIHGANKAAPSTTFAASSPTLTSQ